jgi:hypothetical protein
MASVIKSGYNLTGKTGIDGFLGSIAASGGMSMSNMYEARFEPGGFSVDLKEALKDAGFINLDTTAGAYSALTAFCEEASLPGMMANTGQTTGVYMGEGQVNYAHTKSYTDITLGWTCDANLLPLKFLNKWMNFIFGDPVKGGDDIQERKGSYLINRVRYPDDYQCKELKIIKAERSESNSLGAVGGIYTLHDIFPYSVQSTPVSYGSSTLLKVTAAFYYRRWSFEYEDIKKTRPNK